MEKIDYVVEHIDWKPGGGIDVDGEAICTNEFDDRTLRKKSFPTEEDARLYIATVREQSGKWLASIKLNCVSSVEVSIDAKSCEGCDGSGWQTGENEGCICDYCDVACVCVDKPYDNSECCVHSIHTKVSER